jgi:hypothetical protein
MKLVFKGERHNRIVGGLDKLHSKETKAQEKYLSIIEFHAKPPGELPFLTRAHCGTIFPFCPWSARAVVTVLERAVTTQHVVHDFSV